MRRSSWIVLGICAALLFGLGFAYILSQTSPETLTQEQATQMVQKMQDAVARKDVNTIMNTLDPSPETKVAGINQDTLRVLLSRAFHAMDKPRADVNNLAFAGGKGEATVEFDLSVHNQGPDMNSVPYQGHITVHLKRVDVGHLMGLYSTREWRIVGGSTTGPNPGDMGDY